jgi:hypothetical protein
METVHTVTVSQHKDAQQMTEATLDLFDPMTLVQTLMYQSNTDADYWERQHIDAMVDVCEYIKDTYPAMYSRVEKIHKRFGEMSPTIY